MSLGCRRLTSASNNKQKIKYVEKLRDEITALKAEKSEKDLRIHRTLRWAKKKELDGCPLASK